MFILDLAQLKRTGTGKVRGELPVDDPVWEGVDATPAAPFQVDLAAAFTGTGQLLVRGTLTGTLVQACRRCLEEVRTERTDQLDLVWEDADPDGEGGSDEDEIRMLDPGSDTVDLTDALREEILLRIPRWVVCREDCKGLCPRCGINRNVDNCDCSTEEADPRWAALHGLKLDDERK